MNKHYVKTRDELEKLLADLAAKDCIVDVATTLTGFSVHSIEPPLYTCPVTGLEVYDEVWITASRELIPVQDLTVDHLRNILRMMLRIEEQKTRYNLLAAAMPPN